MSKAIFVAGLLALAEARFGQEQAVASIVSALSNFGQPGQAATLAGATPGVLLAGANACAKLSLADQIVSELGNDTQVIAAAAALVAAEKNFNPFAVSIPSICSDATLPATEALRGIVPLVDPAVTGSDVENANSATSLKTPFSANGLSVADVAKANGFSNFTLQGSDGSTQTGSAASVAATTLAAAATSEATVPCAGALTVTVTSGAAATSTATASESSSSSSSSSDGSVQKSTVAGLDFGLCVPTMKFEAGLDGRKDTEFTFQAIDPLVNKGQEEALNPNIITNRICDQLTNVCKANQAAKDACQSAKTQISSLGTKDASTANAWNTALGFAGTNINPDNAPQPGLVGHD